MLFSFSLDIVLRKKLLMRGIKFLVRNIIQSQNVLNKFTKLYIILITAPQCKLMHFVWSLFENGVSRIPRESAPRQMVFYANLIEFETNEGQKVPLSLVPWHKQVCVTSSKVRCKLFSPLS